ncbi:glycoside hydrolase N-terminal domain-containing protein [Niastella vici]|uniref:glycoside hydrolase N-terminal domain-containing protein n=1 Tax=Niastella vici TaxID=1703345 RepID=UPI0009C02B4B|nr:glycoside hydrolase N-terminal domain-containing protein [Niastella vici]
MYRALPLLLLWFLPAATSLAQQHPLQLWYNSPATQWEAALPLGNGRLGAMTHRHSEGKSGTGSHHHRYNRQ